MKKYLMPLILLVFIGCSPNENLKVNQVKNKKVSSYNYSSELEKEKEEIFLSFKRDIDKIMQNFDKIAKSYEKETVKKYLKVQGKKENEKDKFLRELLQGGY